MTSMIEKCCGTVFDLSIRKSLMEVYLWFHYKKTPYLIFKKENGDLGLLRKKKLEEFFDAGLNIMNKKKDIQEFLEFPVVLLSPKVTMEKIYEMFASKDQIIAIILGKEGGQECKGVITKEKFYNTMKHQVISPAFLQESILPFFNKIS